MHTALDDMVYLDDLDVQQAFQEVTIRDLTLVLRRASGPVKWKIWSNLPEKIWGMIQEDLGRLDSFPDKEIEDARHRLAEALRRLKERERQNLEAVAEIYAGFERGDGQPFLDALSEDADMKLPGGEGSVPGNGTSHGPGEVGFLRVTDEVMEIAMSEPQEFIAHGDKVVVLGQERGRLKSTGQTVEMDWAHVYTFRDEKIVRVRGYRGE